MASNPRLLVVLVAGLGDLMLGMEALASLRAGHPQWKIDLLTNTQAVPLAKRLDCVDSVIGFPIRELRGGPAVLGKILKLCMGLRRNRYDKVVNLHDVGSRLGALKMGLLLRVTGAAKRVGIDHLGQGVALTRKVSTEQVKGLHAAKILLQVALAAGGIPNFTKPVFRHGPEDLGTLKGVLDAAKRPVVAINPGADMPGKRWPVDRFAAVADALALEAEASILLLGGPGEEAVGQAVARAMATPALELTGKMTLDELVGVLGHVDLLLTNDSGPMHMAAALQTPLVALFGQADPEVFSPMGPKERTRVHAEDVPCRPCGKRDCPRPVCLEKIDVRDVVQSCLQMLRAPV